MSRPGTETTHILNFEVNTQKIVEVFKQLQAGSKVPLGENLSKEVKALETETQQFLDNLKNMKPEDLTVDMIKELTKKEKELVTKAERINQKIISSVSKATSVEVKKLEEEIKEIDQRISERTKEVERLEKKFTTDPSGPASVKFTRKEDESAFENLELKNNAELENKLLGVSGKRIANNQKMLEQAANIEKTLQSQKTIHDKISEDIAKGASLAEIKGKLTDEEFKLLEETLNTNHQNLNTEQALQQVYVKKQIEQKKINHLNQQNERIEKLNNQNIAASIIKKEKQLNIEREIGKAKKSTTKEQRQQLEFSNELSKLTMEASTGLTKSLSDLRDSTKTAKEGVEEKTEAVKRNQTTIAKATQQVFSYGIAFSFLRRIYRETLRTVKDLDQALTEMAIVTSMNRSQTWQLVGTMQQLAKETGFTTTEIAKLSTIYFRQGRTLREVTELTRVAAQAARIAGISAAESADFLTSAVNAFQISADQAISVSDRFASLAAQSASSYQELAVGLSKFAAQANVAGVSIDFAMGLLAKGIETTREAPETIGTALKTVIARMRELTDLGKTFEDGMDISRVETSLRQVGIALRDEQGQFRNLDIVLSELGQRWSTLNTNQQASVAVSLAGTRQQSRLIAIMQDFDRTLELVDISQNSAGATMAQHTQFMKGMEAATTNLRTSYQNFITAITDSEVLISIIRGMSSAIDALTAGLKGIGIEGSVAMGLLASLFLVMKFGKQVMAIKNKFAMNAIKIAEHQAALTKAEMVLEQAKHKQDLANALVAQKQAEYQLLVDKKQWMTTQGKAAREAVLNAEKARAVAVNNVTLAQGAVEIKQNEIQAIQDKKSILLKKIRNSQLVQGNILTILYNKIIVGSIVGMKKFAVALWTKIIALKGLGAGLKKATIATFKFALAIFTTPIGWIAAGIFGLVIGLNQLRKAMQGNEDAANSFAGTILGTFKNIIEFAKNLGGSFRTLFQRFQPFISFITGPHLTVFRIILAAITIGINKLINAFNNWILNTGQGSSILTKSFTAIGNGIKQTLDFILKSYGFFLNSYIKAINFLITQFNKIPGVNIRPLREVNFSLEAIGEFTERVQEAAAESQEAAAESTRAVKLQTKSYEELADGVASVRRELLSENFELQQQSRDLNEIIKEYEELERLKKQGIFGAEEQERETNVIEELKNLREQDDFKNLIGFNLDGSNLDSTITELKGRVGENSKIIADNLREIAEESLILFSKDPGKFAQEGFTDITDFLINDLDEQRKEKLTPRQKQIAENFYQSHIAKLSEQWEKLNIEPIGVLPLDIDNIVTSDINVNSIIETVDKFDKAIQKNKEGFTGIREIFSSTLKDLAQFGNEAVDAFRRSNQDLDSLITNLEEWGLTGSNSVDMVLDRIGSSPDVLNRLESAFAGAVEETDNAQFSLGNFLKAAGDATQAVLELNEGIEKSEAVSLAFIAIAESMDDATTAAQIYSLAVGTSLLESSQSADQLASRMENLTKVQTDFLEGTLSSQDMFNFVQQNAKLFEDEDFFEAFHSGASLSRFLIEELEEQFEEFRVQLISTESQIRRYDRMLETANEEDRERITNLRNGAIAERNQLILMNEHRGILHNTTRELLNYNVAQKAFNNLKKIGVTDLQAQTRALEALQESTANSLKQVSERLDSTQEGINAALDGADPSIYFEIVDGVVSITEAFHGLSIAQQTVLADLFESLEGGYEQLFDVFKNLMDETIAMEESMANDRIKVYEDYFAVLDRLEAQRERKVQREDLVAQLSRLEGATDERSRSRALELRRELNKSDQEDAKETLQQSRASLIESISESVERVRQTFTDAFQDFREAGGSSAEALFDTLVSRNLIRPNGSWNEIAVASFPTNINVNLPEAIAEDGVINVTMPPAAEQATFNENVTTPLTNTIDNFLEGGGQAATDFRNELLAKGLINEDGTWKPLTIKDVELIRDIALNVSQDAADFNNDFDNIIGLATNVVDYGYDIGLNTEVTSYDYKIGLDEDAKRLLDSEERESVEKDEKISQATQVLESTRDQFMRDSARSSMTLEQALSEWDAQQDRIWSQILSAIGLESNVQLPTLSDNGSWVQDFINRPVTRGSGGGGSSDIVFAQSDAFPQNAKGGMVDYTGLSMLHGTKTRPEAVLSPSQTQMFVGLRDALEKVAIDSDSSGGVNIENISISTASLNNNQDFKRAGESLADAFKNAIQRKGITVNTNKV